MTKKLILFLTLIAALPLFAAQDVLTIGKISALPGSSVTVPVYLRDLSGTALGADAGAGNRIQGIMLQVTTTPAVPGMTITFEKTGPLSATPLYQRGGNARWIGAWSESSQILPFNTGAASPGDRIGTLRMTLPAQLQGSTIALTFNPATTMLSNEEGTVTESVTNRHLLLVGGGITLSGPSTSTTLSSTPNPSQYGANVTFTANITSQAPSIGGSVIFTESGQIIGSAIVQSGQATWNTSSLAPGTHTITATYEGDSAHLTSTSPSVQQVVNIALNPPANVTATATSSTSVQITWSPAANAEQYEVRRKAPGGSYSTIATIPGTSFNDTNAVAGTTYFYAVRSLAGAATSSDNIDHATAVLFSDDALVAGTTKVKLAHLTELRTAVNAFRVAANLAPASFGAASPTTIEAAHLDALRTALQQARTALGMSSMTFTDAVPTTIKAVHYQELRQAVK